MPARPFIGLTLLILGGTLLACADSDNFVDVPNPLIPTSVTVVNESDFEIQEVRLHHRSDYREPDEQYAEPLAEGEMVDFAEIPSGDWYFTIFREQYQDGPVHAFTTESTFRLQGPQEYLLRIFNAKFRLEEIEPDSEVVGGEGVGE